MVYIDPNEMGYMPMVRSWITEAVDRNLFSQENSEFVHELFSMLDVGLGHVNTKCRFGIKQVLSYYQYTLFALQSKFSFNETT